MRYDFSFGIKTFNRPAHLNNLIKSIREKYTNPITVVDDGEICIEPELLEQYDINYIKIPFDSGISVGRNILSERITEDYFVLMDDDWLVGPKTDIPLMYRAIKALDLDILGGQFLSSNEFNKYYGRLDTANKVLALKNEYEKIEFFDSVSNANHVVKIVDVTNNFFIGKRSSIKSIGWTSKYKTGGEHIDFFYRASKEPFTVGQISSSTIYNGEGKVNELGSYTDNYLKYRMRGQSNLKSFLKENNFDKLDLWFKK